MPVKHFNMGNAFGVVTKATPTKKKKEKEEKEEASADPSKKEEEKEDSGAFVLKVQLLCRSDVHGKVTAFGTVFNEKARAFLEFHKANPDALIKLNGFFVQEEYEGKLYNKLNFFEWEKRPTETPRAGFHLTGELLRIIETGEEKLIRIKCVRPKGKEEGSDLREEEFSFYLHPKNEKRIKKEVMDSLTAGATVTLSGYLCQMGEYNEFTDQREGEVKPYVKEIKVHS